MSSGQVNSCTAMWPVFAPLRSAGSLQRILIEIAFTQASAEAIVRPAQLRALTGLMILHVHQRRASILIQILGVLRQQQGFKQRVFTIVEFDL